MKLALIGTVLFFAWNSVLEARVFTDTKGRTLEGELVSATESTAKIKMKNGSIATIPLKTFSEKDQEFVKKFRAEFMKNMLGRAASDSREAGSEKAVDAAASKIVSFVQANKGKQVGNGECWTLANEAYKFADLKRPGKDLRVWGRQIDHKKEALQPGDIIELEAAEFGNGMKFFGNHTSVVIAADKRGNFTVLEQNINGKRFVQEKTYQISDLKSGSMKAFRYSGN